MNDTKYRAEPINATTEGQPGQFDRAKKVAESYYSRQGEKLLRALRRNDVQELAKLLSVGTDPNVKEQNDKTALMIVSNGLHITFPDTRIKMATLLIEAGADVNAKSSNGWTALMFAARDGYEDVVKLLLEKGAGVNARNEDGFTALKLARVNNRKGIMKILQENGATE